MNQAHSRRDGTGLRMKALPDPVEKCFEVGIIAGMPGDKICLKIWIWQFQKRLKQALFRLAERVKGRLEKVNQQHVELAHASAAAPTQSRAVVVQPRVYLGLPAPAHWASVNGAAAPSAS